MTLVNILFLRKKTPANIAKKRLQKIVSERRIINKFTPYFLPQLEKDIIQITRKYIHNPHILAIKLEKKDQKKSILKFKIIFFHKDT